MRMLPSNWNRRETSLVALILATTSILLFEGFVGVPPATGARLHPELARVAVATRGDFLGCPYPSGNVWQTNVAGMSPDPRSSAWLGAMIAAGGDGGFEATIPTDELINDANGATPRVPVRPKVHWHQPVSPIPWQPNFYIEPLSDRHSLVLETKSCQYYEGYETTYDARGELSVYSNLHVDLTRPFVRSKTNASTASGLPIGLMAIRPEELAAGVIGHAIGWNAVANTLSETECVSPAAIDHCTDSLRYRGPSGETPMPYGAHARLKSSFNIDGFSREAKIVAQAMKTHGLYVYDTGCCDNVVPLVNDRYGAPAWTRDDARDLRSISPKDLEIVPPP
ncbi:MAG: hypothetical protein WB810_14035 [Candidatus Cybelea sp.]